ncbi:hypothetical protein [Crossiella sp. NPDC003009]
MSQHGPPPFLAVVPATLDADGQLYDESITVDVPDIQPEDTAVVRLTSDSLDDALILTTTAALSLATALSAAMAVAEAHHAHHGEPRL